MRVIIVEDEATATRKLEALLKKVDVPIAVLATLESVKDTIGWLKTNTAPDIGFFDIQLADDTCFEIFEQCDVDFPVVFITAYDDYLLQAFEHNSIHYLLKPLNEEKLRQALQKVRQMEKHFILTRFRNFLSEKTDAVKYKTRLIVRKGMDYAPVDTGDIAFIFTRHKISFMQDRQGETYMADLPLRELEKQLDPARFFRANRQYIVCIDAIKRFKSVEQGKLLLELEPKPRENVIIGKENAVAFRRWLRQS